MSQMVEGWDVHHFDVVTSTMDLARQEYAQSKNLKKCVFLAASQTKGRGRHGRSWLSPQGGLYLTAVYPWKGPVHQLAGLSLVVGLALRDSLGEAAAKVKLKWPNDLVVGLERKLAGILIEVLSEPNQTAVLIGIGLNINPVVFESGSNLETTATAGFLRPIGLHELSKQSILPTQILNSLLQNLNFVIPKFEELGFEAFRPIWNEVSALQNQQVEVDIGSQSVSGIVVGVNATGCLQIESEGKVCDISSGHIVKIGCG